MTIERRPQLAQRRRRVLYSHQCEDAQLQVTGRRADSLREARRPTTAYGSRVYRRLRSRWFGIVPVRRRTMMLVASVLGMIVLLLTAAHAAALGWAPLVYRADVARPFRLDRPDSFGNWLGTLLLASGSVVSLMIYQLRRHRTSDFRGHYRLWRPAIMILAIASIDTSMRLSDWLGHVVDVGLGERRAIAGGDWIRLLLVVGGATFGMRMIAEVRRSKLATAALALAAVMLTLPTLARWNIIKVASLSGTTLLSAAPLIGSALLWISLVGYLRMLYRDVRNLDEGDRIADHVQKFRQRIREATQRSPRPEPSAEAVAKTVAGPPATRATKQADRDEEAGKREEKQARKRTDSRTSNGGDEGADEEDAPPRKRRWFGLRAAKPDATAEDETSRDEDEEAAPSRKRRWFGLRAAKPDAAAEDSSAADAAGAEEAGPRPKRRWLPKVSMRLRPRTVDEDAPEESEDASTSAGSRDSEKIAGTLHAGADRGETEEEEYIDPESIDWNGLSKSERRRVKRQLRRQDRAA